MVWIIAGIMLTSICSATLIHLDRNFWDTNQLTDLYTNIAIKREIDNPIKIDTMYEVGGSCRVAYILASEFKYNSVGIMVASSSGMPAANLGLMMTSNNQILLDSFLNTGSQEESVVANWVMTEHPKNDNNEQKDFFNEIFHGAWGIKDISRNCTNNDTFQGVDFVTTTNPKDFRDIWIKYNINISLPISNYGNICLSQRTICASLIFGAGPNAGTISNINRTFQRTRNIEATANYDFFIEGVKHVLRAKFDAAIIRHNITVFVVDRTSIGAYLGPHKDRLIKDGHYHTLVQSVLDEKIGPNGEKRWQYITHAVLAANKNLNINLTNY